MAELKTKLLCDSCPGEFCYAPDSGISRLRGYLGRYRPVSELDIGMEVMLLIGTIFS